MASEQRDRSEPAVSGWAVGGMAFAATVLMIVGVFQVIAGLVAIFDDEFYVVTANYTFDLDTSAWGWIHLLLGIALLATGFGLFSARRGRASPRSSSPILSASPTSSSSRTTRSGRSS